MARSSPRASMVASPPARQSHGAGTSCLTRSSRGRTPTVNRTEDLAIPSGPMIIDEATTGQIWIDACAAARVDVARAQLIVVSAEMQGVRPAECVYAPPSFY